MSSATTPSLRLCNRTDFQPRTAATITFGCSTTILLNIVWGGYFNHHPAYLSKFPPEIWRPVTCFIPTSPQLGLIFDTYFLYSYMAQLEISNPRFPRKADLVWYLMFICSTILVSAGCLSCALLIPRHPSYICPDSALPLQLSRFLEMRKITPALRIGPSFAKIRAGLRCRHGGIVIWMARVIPNSLEWFFSALHLYVYP